MAVGLSLKQEKFEEFKNKIEDVAKDAHTDELISIVKIDKEIHSEDITIQTVDSLKLLEPFGEANKTPLFLYRNLRIDSIRALSEGKHLKLTLKDEGIIVQAIGFNIGYLAEDYQIGNKVDIVASLEINEYGGNRMVQFNIKDIRKGI